MRTFAVLSAGLAAVLVPLLPVEPAQAIPRTFVSGTGSGSACTRAAPCATFQAAHAATDDGGEITCLDAGDFYGSASVLISKSITIDCGGTMGTIFSSSVQGFSINTANVIVRLRNLTINGGNIANAGIRFVNGLALFVENCLITNVTVNPARGIYFQTPSSGTAKLFVSDSIISNNGIGIDVQPGTGSARVMLDRVRLENNGIGMSAIAQSPQSSIVHVRDSHVVGNQSGLVAQGGFGFTAYVVDRTSVMFNSSNGIFVNGTNGAIHIGNSTVIGNGTGLNAVGGGKIFSYQNNQATGNTTDGAPTNLLTLK